MLQNAYEMVLSPKFSVFSRIKKFLFLKLETFHIGKKIENWRRTGSSRNILQSFFWKPFLQKVELLGSCLLSFRQPEWRTENHPRKRWVFLPIVCQYCLRLVKLGYVRKTALKTHIFSSGLLEGSFVNTNGIVASSSPKTFRQKSKLLLKIWKNLEKKNSRQN